MRWFRHQSELGCDSSALRFWVGWIRIKLPKKIRPHRTSYLSHVLSAVNMNLQFDIYCTNRKTQLNYMCTKLNGEFQIFRFIGKGQIYIQKEQLVKCWVCMLQFVTNILYLHPPQTLTRNNTGNVRTLVSTKIHRPEIFEVPNRK